MNILSIWLIISFLIITSLCKADIVRPSIYFFTKTPVQRTYFLYNGPGLGISYEFALKKGAVGLNANYERETYVYKDGGTIWAVDFMPIQIFYQFNIFSSGNAALKFDSGFILNILAGKYRIRDPAIPGVNTSAPNFPHHHHSFGILLAPVLDIKLRKNALLFISIPYSFHFDLQSKLGLNLGLGFII